MGTRGIIMVRGYSEHGARNRSELMYVRLYQHWDSSPQNVLGQLAETTRLAQNYLDANDHLDLFTNDGHRPTLDEMPCLAFAQHLMYASMGWGGQSIKIDSDNGTPAIFDGRGAVNERLRLGSQGDLEWVYEVNLDTLSLTVYGHDYGDPLDHKKHGPVDPRLYALQLRADEPYQERAFLGITRDLATLARQGWAVTAPKAKRKRAVDRLTRSAWHYLCQKFAHAPYRDEFLPHKEVGDFSFFGVWADRLDDGGHHDVAKEMRGELPC